MLLIDWHDKHPLEIKQRNGTPARPPGRAAESGRINHIGWGLPCVTRAECETVVNKIGLVAGGLGGYFQKVRSGFR